MESVSVRVEPILPVHVDKTQGCVTYGERRKKDQGGRNNGQCVFKTWRYGNGLPGEKETVGSGS